MVHQTVVKSVTELEETGDVPIVDLIPFMSMCCIITSCYTQFPQCIGAVSENNILCLNQKVILCKTSRESDACCKCCLLDCDLVTPSTCFKTRSQICCLDARASLPCSEEIPCLVTLCFYTCCFKYHCKSQCCSSVKDLEASI